MRTSQDTPRPKTPTHGPKPGEPMDKSIDSFETLEKDTSGQGIFQIISDDVEIDKTMIRQFASRAEDFNLDYKICGIIGTQSTGKSTLLNYLFDCNFKMLDSTMGRTQTTKGIWGSFIDDLRLLALDIEGSDSMVRNAKDQNAENKICTFGLLMSHVLLGRIWGFGANLSGF